MSDKSSPSPTKSILAPDGSQINYPQLPSVGEKYQSRSAMAHELHETPPQTRPPALAPSASTESFRDRLLNTARATAERVGVYGQAAVNALVLDDWKALTNGHSTPLQRIESGANLASWAIPEGKIAELAARASERAIEVVASHVATASIGHATEAAGLSAARGLGRPLTDAERSGDFSSFKDFKKYMGPATMPGGELRHWHHVVEKVHADEYGHFTPEQVHSIKNVVPAEVELHQGTDGLTSAFATKDRRLGTSLRERLEGRPWEEHVDAGEQALLKRGISADELKAMRAETRAIFDERLLEHDRKFALSKEHGALEAAPRLATPGLLSVAAENAHADSSGRSSASPSRVEGTPDTSHDELADSQVQKHEGTLSRRQSLSLNVERDGRSCAVVPGYKQQGRILTSDSDQIVQDVGRGRTATYSRKELEIHFGDDPKAFDAMIQPGNYVSVSCSRNGIVDLQQQIPGHGWQSLGIQPLSAVEQSPLTGYSLGR